MRAAAVRFQREGIDAGRGPMKWNALAEQSSSLCRALSAIGDRWTLLILNQCFLEYLLTEKGRQLYPVLLALVRWGNALLIEEARPSIRGHVPCGRRR